MILVPAQITSQEISNGFRSSFFYHYAKCQKHTCFGDNLKPTLLPWRMVHPVSTPAITPHLFNDLAPKKDEKGTEKQVN
jgi:hypothetical protein